MNKNTIPSIIKLAMRVIEEYKIESAYDAKRYDTMCDIVDINIERFFNNEPIDSGIYGKVYELSLHRSNSTITKVHSNRFSYDFYIKTDNGKLIKTESKTNGGRIGTMLNMSDKEQKSKYIVYNLAHVVPQGKPKKDGSCKPEELRYITICTTIYNFINILEECNAIKVIKHSEADAEPAIQKDSKKLYKALKAHGEIHFDRNAVYFADDIA